MRLLAAEAVAPRLGLSILPDGTRRLEAWGTEGTRFDVQVSTNLVDWTRWQGLEFGPSPQSVVDSEPMRVPWLFYRLREAGAVRAPDFLLGLGGAGPATTGQSFANQTVSDGTQNLLAVPRLSPSDAILVQAAGEWGGDTVNFLHQSSVLEATVDPLNRTHAGTRVRFTVFARQNRLWKFDHRSGLPPEPWTSLSLTQICSASYAVRRVVPDYADARQSWMFFITPGPSGSCFKFPDDSRSLGLKLSMDGQASVRTTATPLVPIYTPGGALSGMVMQDGGQVQAVDTDLGQPRALFSVPNAPLVIQGVTNYTTYTRGFLFGHTAPGRWLYLAVHQNLTEFLMGYDLAGRTGPVPIIRFSQTSGAGSVGTLFGDWCDTDGSHVYLAMNSGVSTSSIVRVDESFQLRTLGGLPGVVNELSLTENHVVVRSGRRFFSVPKAGGVVRELASVPEGEDLVPRFRMRRAARTVDHPTLRQRQFLTSTNLVWFETARVRTSPTRSAVYSIAADGSEASLTRMADQSIVTWTAPSQVPWCVEGPAFAVYVASQWTPTVANGNRADYGGQPVHAYSAGDRSLWFELGRFPSPTQRIGSVTLPVPVSKSEMYGEPLQWGQPGLLPIRGRALTSSGAIAGTDLLYFRSDAPSLIPVTHYGLD